MKKNQNTKTKFLGNTTLNIVLWAGRHFSSCNEKLKSSLNTLQKVLSQENEETKQMMQVYLKQVRGEASRKEIKLANKQFLDILKATGVGVFALIPFSLPTLPFFVALGRKVGIEILPSAVQEVMEEEKKQKQK